MVSIIILDDCVVPIKDEFQHRGYMVVFMIPFDDEFSTLLDVDL